jgi:hypothetical protein
MRSRAQYEQADTATIMTCSATLQSTMRTARHDGCSPSAVQ